MSSGNAEVCCELACLWNFGSGGQTASVLFKVVLLASTIADSYGCGFGILVQVESAEIMLSTAFYFILAKYKPGRKGDAEAGHRMGATDAEALHFSDELRHRRCRN